MLLVGIKHDATSLQSMEQLAIIASLLHELFYMQDYSKNPCNYANWLQF